MILKFKTTVDKGTENERDQWNYIDGFSSAHTFYNKEEKCVCIAIDDYAVEGQLVLALYDEAYLLNDKGATIERIVGVG